MKKSIKQSLQGLIDNLRRKRKLSKLERTQIRFRERYPDYRIGSHSYGMPEVHQWEDDSTLTIGDYCSIAKSVQIFLGGNHRTDWVSSYPFPAFFQTARHIPHYNLSKGNVTIGNDVWIGQNATILSGVNIGDGAVIAANAVVSRNVEAYAIVAGNPARQIKWRFDEATRSALLATAWWNWPEAEILSVVELICSEDIETFLAYARHRNQN